MATPSAEQICARLFLAHGDEPDSRRNVLDFTEASDTSGNFSAVIPVEIAAAGTNTAVDISAYVDSATFISILDRGGTGFKVSLVNTGAKFEVEESGVFAFKNGGTPTTIYLDNGSASDKAFLEIGVIGSRS